MLLGTTTSARLLRVIGMQVGVALLLGLILWATSGRIAAISALLGGAIAFVPASLYALRIQVSSTDPRVLLKVHFRAEAFKTAGTILLFGATFLWFKNVAAFWLFVSYGVTLSMYWVALVTDE
jgi:ATP synthase protein I